METNRRKKSSPDTKGIPEDVYEFIVQSSIYDKLENMAMTKKLTDVHVKDIIKNVVYGINPENPYGPSTSDSGEAPNEPKTRAKKKELYQKQMIMFTNYSEMTNASISSQFETGNQLNVTQPDTNALVNTEFPEEDDVNDKEYIPDLDEQLMSDEESILSLLGSPASTTASQSSTKNNQSPLNYAVYTPRSEPPLNPHKKAKMMVTQNNGVVKRTLNFSEEHSSLISNRTRSKYPMTDTPLEYIEMSFIPPDITTDMYDTDTYDDTWKQFLLDFVQPEAVINEHHEDDEQGDPEYDLLEDAQKIVPTFDELREEFREGRIPKREVNELVMESLELSFENDILFNNNYNNNYNYTNINDMWINLEQQLGDSAQIETEIIDIQEEQNPEPIVVTYLLHEFTKDQLDILQSQLRVHVQLLTQSVFMTCFDQRIQYVEDGCKNMLDEIASISQINSACKVSLFETSNLASALESVAKYDLKREQYLLEQKGKKDIRVGKRCTRIFLPPFPKMFEEIFLESSAFPYIQYLPYGLFWVCYHKRRKGLLRSEYYLIASGFKEILPSPKVFCIEENMQYQKRFDKDLMKVCTSLLKTCGIATTEKGLSYNLKRILLRIYNEKEDQEIDPEDKTFPFVYYVKTGSVNLPPAKVEHLPKCIPFALKDITPQDLQPQGPNNGTPCALKHMPKKFLPKYFFKLVHKYQAQMKSIAKNKNLSAPAVKPDAMTKKIVILQEGQVTKIVLPADSAVVIENARPNDVMTNNDDVRYATSAEIVPLQSGFPSNIAAKIKPVNTVVPTPVTNVTTYSQSNSVNFVRPSSIHRRSNTALPYRNGQGYADHCTQSNSGVVESSYVSSNSIYISPQKYGNNSVFTPVKSLVNCPQSLELSQNEGISVCNTSTVSNFNGSNNTYVYGDSSAQQASVSVLGSPAHTDMPFLMETPKKMDKVQVIIRPHIPSGTKYDQISPLDETSFQTSYVNENVSLTAIHEDLSLSNMSHSRYSESIINNIDKAVAETTERNSIADKINNTTEGKLKKVNCIDKRKPRGNKKANNKRKRKNIKEKINKNSKILKGTKRKTEELNESQVEDEVMEKIQEEVNNNNLEEEANDINEEDNTADDSSDHEDDDDDGETSFEMKFFKNAKSLLGDNFDEFLSLFDAFARGTKSPRFIYPKVRKIFRRYPDMQNEFLLFFNPDQAKQVGKATEHRIVMCTKHLFNNRTTPELIDKDDVIDTLKSVLSLPNKKPQEVLNMLKPILSLSPNLLEHLS